MIPAMIASAFPAMVGGSAVAGGAAVGAAGFSGLLGGLALGSAATGGKAATGGLFGAGGQFSLFPTLTTAGMGAGLAQAFGGTSAGSAPTYKIPLSKEGKALEKSLYETIKKQHAGELMPPNIASIYIGQIKRQEGRRQRESRKIMGGFLTRPVGTGAPVKAMLAESGARLEGLAGPAKWKALRKEEESINALKNLANLRNLQLQTPVLKAESMFTKSLLGQMRSAQQGQALGDIAQYLATVKYPASY